MTVDTKVHDITFNFNDSCNCFSPCCKNKDKFYVNHRGSIEKFDSTKDNEKSLERAINNLFETIDKKLYPTTADIKKVKEAIKPVIADINIEKAITADHLKRINSIILNHLPQSNPISYVDEEAICIIL